MDVWKVSDLDMFHLRIDTHFLSLQREADGKFNDTKLAAILKAACVFSSGQPWAKADNTAELSNQRQDLGLMELLIP